MTYELSYIIKGDLEETKVKEETEGLTGFISKIGQSPKLTVQPKIQTLAYPIKKQTRGFWGMLEFDLEIERLPELEKKLKESKEIIRFMLTKKRVEKEEKKVKKPAQSEALGRARQTAELSAGKKKPAQSKALGRARQTAELSAGKKKEEKVEIKDLDKKLDEILKEV